MRKIRLIIFFFLLVSASSNLYAQDIFGPGISIDDLDIDNLRSALKNSVDDTSRVDVLGYISLYFLDADPDSAILYIEETIRTADKLDMKYETAFWKSILGYVYGTNMDYTKNLELLTEGKAMLSDTKLPKYIPESSKRFLNTTDPNKIRLWGLAYNFRQYGMLYHRIGNLELGRTFFNQSLQLFRTVGSEQDIADLCMNLAEIHKNMNQLDSAMEYAQESLNLFQGNNKYLGTLYWIVGLIHSRKKDYNQAILFFNRAIESNKITNALRFLILSEVSLAQVYLELKEYDSAKRVAEEALVLINESGYNGYRASVYKVFASYNEAVGNFEEAYHFATLSQQLKSSRQSEKQKNINVFHNTLLIENLNNRDLAEQRREEENKRTTIGLVMGLVVLAFIVFLLYWNNRQKHKSINSWDRKK